MYSSSQLRERMMEALARRANGAIEDTSNGGARSVRVKLTRLPVGIRHALIGHG